MGSNSSKMIAKRIKPPEILVSDIKVGKMSDVTCDYIEVEDAKNAILDHTTQTQSPRLSASLSRQKTPSPQLVNNKSSDYMEPWDCIPGKTIHNAVSIVNSQPMRSQDSPENEFLSECSWYHGNITRRDAEKVLTSLPLYSFLVRRKGENEYTLSLKYQFGYIHMMIDYEGGKFTLGSLKTRQFLTLLDLVNHYQRFPMDVEGVGKIQLKIRRLSG